MSQNRETVEKVIKLGNCRAFEARRRKYYNIVMMEEVQAVIGVGCGASSKFIDRETGKITQFYNPKDPAAYIMSYEESIEKKLAHLENIFPASTTISIFISFNKGLS